jgi:hypothetical protein
MFCINPQGGPKLTDDLRIPRLLKSHKRKNAPLIKLVDQSINLRVIMLLQRIKHYCLVSKERGFGTTLTLLKEYRMVVVLMKLRPKPLLNTCKLDEVVGIL